MDLQDKTAARTTLLGLAALAAWVLGAARPAVASFEFTPAGGTTTAINGFVPLSGNALAAGGNQAVLDSLTGSGPTSYQVYYQASLSSFLGANQQSVPIPNGQYTIVASFTEQVVPGSVSNGSAAFMVAPTQSSSSYLDIYYNPTNVSTPLTGAGFVTTPALGYANGQLVLSGTPIASLTGGAGGNFLNTTIALGATPQNFDNVPGYTNTTNPYQTSPGVPMQSDQGTGSSTINFNTTYANTAFLPGGAPSLLTLNYNGSTVAPFNGVDPSKVFITPTGSAIVPTLGTVNGAIYNGTNPDFQFQASGQINQVVVPEPSSLGLTALGLGGLLAYARRRRARTA